MTKDELREVFKRAGVSDNAYSLDGTSYPERYVIEEEVGSWSVFYSERGLKSGLHRFESESEACDYMLDLILNDPTSREGHRS